MTDVRAWVQKWLRHTQKQDKDPCGAKSQSGRPGWRFRTAEELRAPTRDRNAPHEAGNQHQDHSLKPEAEEMLHYLESCKPRRTPVKPWAAYLGKEADRALQLCLGLSHHPVPPAQSLYHLLQWKHWTSSTRIGPRLETHECGVVGYGWQRCHELLEREELRELRMKLNSNSK